MKQLQTREKLEVSGLPITKELNKIVETIDNLLKPFQHMFDVMIQRRAGQVSTVILTITIKNIK